MKDWKLIDALFYSSDLHLKDLNKGLTNKNYLLEINGERCVLRVPCADSTRIVERRHETLALKAIQGCGIDVETLYYDEASGYKVTRYLPNARTYGECTLSDKIERAAKLMKRFHSLQKKSGVFFDAAARWRQYASHLRHPSYDIFSYRFLMDAIAQLSYTPCLCHNDWVDGNLLFDGERLYLIDYEYAADNDPLFDVMSFLSENQIYDEQERKRFYHVYFDEINEDIRKRLLLWEAVQHLLWCTWALMMQESRKEKVYAGIAKEKWEALQRVSKHPCIQALKQKGGSFY